FAATSSSSQARKHQKPSSKLQRNPKFQAPNHDPRFELGTWSLEFGASLELGAGNLELFPLELLWRLEFGVWSFIECWFSRGVERLVARSRSPAAARFASPLCQGAGRVRRIPR